MALNITIEKKHVYIILGVLSLFTVMIFVWAASATPNPGHSSGEIALTCPSGFTLISSSGRDLGCMQTAEANTGTALAWNAAADYCFDNHGGRLASSGEWYIAMANYVLTDETDDYEWNDDADYFNNVNQHAISGAGSIEISSTDNDASVHPFRCWVVR